ncbi:unnamed protein product [Echinostoma caproni]|uniref:Uncharacterized protein n=1 Tax=Echinostoma caproni TaxID=27848 RepID=A0A183AVF4_9TREM|nr:unnamed protein product [Echinostoma caproni]
MKLKSFLTLLYSNEKAKYFQPLHRALFVSPFISRPSSQHNAVKIPWPNVFADGDVEKWIRDFELNASCNGIKGSVHLVTALGALLTGRARAVYDLNLESNQALDYEHLKAALVAEFSKEGNGEKAS